jgi:nardilysin
MVVMSDEDRKQQLLCSLAHSDNPAKKFAWGNLITLRDNITDDDLYIAVHEFKEKHYSAQRMTLAVQVHSTFIYLVSISYLCTEQI